MNNMWGSMAQFEAIYWSWPIVSYLFLAGLSAGSVMVALLVKWNRHENNTRSIWDAMVKAGALIGPIAICIGLFLLIADLGKPFTFYILLIKYNFLSVMSLGVLFLLIYTPFAFLFAIIIFEKEIENSKILAFLKPVTKFIRSFSGIAKKNGIYTFYLGDLCGNLHRIFAIGGSKTSSLEYTYFTYFVFAVRLFKRNCGKYFNRYVVF